MSLDPTRFREQFQQALREYDASAPSAILCAEHRRELVMPEDLPGESDALFACPAEGCPVKVVVARQELAEPT